MNIIIHKISVCECVSDKQCYCCTKNEVKNKVGLTCAIVWVSCVLLTIISHCEAIFNNSMLRRKQGWSQLTGGQSMLYFLILLGNVVY